AGITPEEFRAGVAAGKLGHVGLRESALLLARGLGWKLDRVEETIDCVVATKESPRDGIAPGRVAGVHQIARGEAGGVEVITLDLEMSVGVPGPHDRVQVPGDPPLDVVVQGGVQGDRGTVGAVLSAIPRVLSGPPGLRTIADLPLFGVLL